MATPHGASHKHGKADATSLEKICTHLEQKDLLELARSARIFRALLLSRAGRSIWAAARLAEELPLPKGMSEVQLAVFMEGRACCVSFILGSSGRGKG